LKILKLKKPLMKLVDKFSTYLLIITYNIKYLSGGKKYGM
jgi:hypothetical protein